eukprot:4144356-Amphidinium_carterae.1
MAACRSSLFPAVLTKRLEKSSKTHTHTTFGCFVGGGIFSEKECGYNSRQGKPRLGKPPPPEYPKRLSNEVRKNGQNR